MKTKKQYEAPSIEILELETKDIILTSGTLEMFQENDVILGYEMLGFDIDFQ